MPYEWKFNPRPYSDAEAANLLKDVVSPETADWHYNRHHKGYVGGLNAIEAQLVEADREAANGNYSHWGEAKRRFPWNHAGTVLHDVYWMNLGGDGDINKAPELKKAIEENFGSVDQWRADFHKTAFATKLSGWGILVHDQMYSGRLLNVMVDEHMNGAIWGGIPLVACDMFEHAYYHKSGPDRNSYIEAFLNNLHWERINAHFKKYQR